MIKLLFFDAIIPACSFEFELQDHQTSHKLTDYDLLPNFVLGFNDNITHHNNVLVLNMYWNSITFTTDSIK